MSVRCILWLVLCMSLAACGSSGSSTSVSPSPSTAAGATPTAVAPTAPQPLPSATSTARPAPTPVATPTPLPSLTRAEQDLVDGVRNDLVNCLPRRTDLPPRALAGVECQAASALVARVGIYGFGSAGQAALTYLERLAAAGVAPNTGGCSQGKPGESAWAPGDGEQLGDEQSVTFDGRPLVVYRSGCFRDENGNANFRATCGDGTYVGVLGRTRDIKALNDWAWAPPKDADIDTPSPPGICYGEPGGLDTPD